MPDDESITLNVTLVSFPAVVSLSTSAAALTVTVAMTTSPASVAVQEARDAYQLALAEGFAGTRAEWLASLTGAPGPAGAAGSGLPWISLTEAEFEALAVKDPDTIYDLTDILP